MNETLTIDKTAEQDRRISQAVAREESRLRAFIRRRVADAGDAEDILQEVFSELVEAVRLMTPIDQVGAWLFRVARNRITDLVRKRPPEAPRDVSVEGEAFALEDLLPSPGGGPRARRSSRRARSRARRVAGRAARGLHRPRVGGAQLQRARRGEGPEHQHLTVAKALRGPPPAPAAARRL